MSVEERLRKLENQITFAKGAAAVFVAFGITTSGAAAWLYSKMPSPSDLDHAKAELTDHVKFEINNGLVAGYNSNSVLAQVQAQGMCVGIAGASDSQITAVKRPMTNPAGMPHDSGNNNSGYMVCDQVCEGVESLNVTRLSPGVCFAGVHIFDEEKPVVESEGPGPLIGLKANVYSKNEACPQTVDGFGPNYCCCESEY